MAFENINWGMPVQAKMNEAANFQSMIGQAIASYQANQERDIKRRQLEMEGVNVEKVAENALLKQNMGMPLTPKEQAAIQTMGQIGRPQIYMDSYGQQVVQPSPWASLGLSQGQLQPIGAMRPSQAQGDAIYGEIPPVDLNAPIQSNGKTPLGPPLNQNMILGMETLPPVAPKMPANEMPNLKVDGPLAGTPRGALMEAEALLKLKGEKAKANVDVEKQKKLSAIPELKIKEGYAPSDTEKKEMVKIKAAYDQLVPMFETYGKTIAKYGTPVAGTKSAKDLEGQAANIRMTLKELEGLGALQAPDIKAMEEMMGSPILFSGSLGDLASNPIESVTSTYSKATKGAQIGLQSTQRMKEYLYNKLKTQAEARGYEIKGTKPRLTPEQARAELARRKGQ